MGHLAKSPWDFFEKTARKGVNSKSWLCHYHGNYYQGISGQCTSIVHDFSGPVLVGRMTILGWHCESTNSVLLNVSSTNILESAKKSAFRPFFA
jgi:hypothetical protein